jgi:site-specific recombinase XerD
LHGNLPLVSITKQHLSDYVAHLGKVRIKDQPLAPSTVKQRLEKLSAILEFAMTADAVPHNVGKTVKAPKDTRSQGDQVYKPFTKPEVCKLVDVATDICKRFQACLSKCHGMSSSMRAAGCPAAMASSVALR